MPNMENSSNSRYTNALAAPAIEALLDSIHELESSSGRNPAAYKEDKWGSYGEYRIRRETYKDLQKAFPAKYGKLPFIKAMDNPAIARNAARDYLGIMKNYMNQNGVLPSAGMLLAGYNGGMGNVVRGTLTPEAITYANRGLEMTTSKLGTPYAK